MFIYPITKVQPEDPAEDWISIWDIGKTFSGRKLTLQEYLDTEDRYVKAISLILSYLNINSVNIRDVVQCPLTKDIAKENKDGIFTPILADLYPPSLLDTYSKVSQASVMSCEELQNIIRLALREDIGGKYYVPYQFKLFIGYDYMVSVHSAKPLEPIFGCIENLGLYIYRYGNTV